MIDLKDIFGVNVEAQFLTWFYGEYATDVEQRHEGRGVTLVLLGAPNRLSLIDEWDSPLECAEFVAHIGDVEAARADNGTLQNVEGKLRFFLRTGVRWTEEDPPIHLVEEGDFPWEGAGEYRGFIGGMSGLPGGKLDWDDFTRCVDKLIELIAAVTSAAIERANELRKQEGSPLGTKYLKGIDVSDLFPVDEPSEIAAG